jgi:hypothetical protein
MKIYIGGINKVIILNTDESRVREITTHDINFNLLYNERNDQLKKCDLSISFMSSKYKNPSFTKNIKILHLQNIKILHLQKI